MTPDESEIVELLGRAFPSLAGLDPAEGLRRADSLGRYAAGLWPVGPQGLAAKNVLIPPDAHQQLAPAAAAAGKAPGAGAAFLVALRRTLQDERFAPVLASIGAHFARAAASKSSATHTALDAVGATTSAALTAVATPTRATPTTPPAPSGATPTASGAPPKGGGGPVTLREVGGFELVKLLGEGGMGKVFKARQKSLDRVVALKVLSPQLAQDAEYVDRFKREAVAAAALRHQNIVGVIEHGTDAANGTHFIAFEFVDGMTVEGMLKAKHKFAEREALATCRAVASALECAEAAGIVHRDIKPENIIVGKDGVPRVVDLGLAKKQDDKSQMTVVGVVMGTPQYMAPEQALGVGDIDQRADLYALGMTLFRLVTGQFAFDAESSTGILMKRLTDPCPDPRAVEPSISEGCQRIILKLAQKEKEDRYQHAAELIKDLDLVLAGKPLAAVAQARAAPKPAPRPAAAAAQGITVALPIPSEPPWLRELVPRSIPGAAQPAEAPPDPVVAAIVHQARTGDSTKAREAAARIVAGLPRLQDPKACARAEAQLARLALVLGDRANAEKWARAAIDHDPCSADGFDVLSRAGRGEGSRHQLEALLAAAREAVAQGKPDQARRWAEKAHEAFFHDPQPHLATAVACKLAGDEPGFVDALRAAWGAYPPKERPDAALGGLDGLAADLLVAHGRSAFKETGLVKATVDGVDDKQNLIAGALRLAIGVARVALERGGLSAFGERRLHFAVCRALSGLRRYDEALLALGRAAALGPTDVERQAHEAERLFIATARAVPVPVPGGKYRCPGASALVEQTSAHGRAATRDKAAKLAEVEKLGPELATLAGADPAVRAELRQVAEKLGLKDPFAHLEPIEQELAGLGRERNKPAEKKEEKKESGGFFSKLKEAAAGAAAVAAGAARDAQLKLKKAQLEGQHEGAAKALAVSLTKELREGQYRHPKLVPIMRKAAAFGVAIDWLTKEEARATKDVERLSSGG